MAKNFTTNIVIGGKLNPSLQKALNSAGQYAKKTSDIMAKTNDKAAKSTENLQNKFISVGNAAKKVAIVGGVVSGAAILGGKAMIEQASSLEQYKNTLNVVMKDQKKAAEIFKWATQFANKTPFETDEVVDATVKLQSYGLEAQKIIPFVGDMASAMGKGLDQAVEAIADAQTGELERLKEFGITKQMIIDQGNKKLKGIELVNSKGQITNQKAFNLALMSLMQERYEGSMDIQSKSWKGLVSTITGVAKSGLAQIAGISQTGEIIPGSAFDIAKQKITQLADAFTKLQDSGKFDELQKKLSNLVNNGIKKVEEIVPKVIEFTQNIINNGPKIIETVERIAIGFIAWKAIEGIANGIILIANLTTVLGKLRTVHLASVVAKAKDIAATLYLQGLYAKDAIVAGLKTAGTWAMVAAQGALNLITAIGTGVMSAFGAVLAFITSPIGLVVLAIGALIAIGVLLYKNWDVISNSLVAVWQNNVLPFFEGIGAWFGGVFDSIGGAFKGMINWVIGGLNTMIKAVNKLQIKVPKWVPGLGGETIGFTIPEIPAFARGGIATRASIFGEAGPEMAIPLKPKNPRSISLLNQTSKILGVSSNGIRSGGNTFVYAPNLNGSNNQDIQKELGISFEEFKSWIKRYFHEEQREAL